VLIMDEPTAALSGHEVERLFGVVRTLRERGAGVLFISHRLEEIFAICDTVTVLRDGEVTHDGVTAEMNTDELVRRMVGRELSQMFPKEETEIGDVALAVDRLTREGVFIDVSFEVRRGEIVGLAGLVGAGRSEVARAIFGIDTPDGGHVEVDGVSVVNLQEAYAKALRVDREALRAAQDVGDVLGGHAVLLDAFNADVRPACAAAREALGAAADPIQALRDSGYADRMARAREPQQELTP
jgi:ABC-type sugar transport system ATPase subunit